MQAGQAVSLPPLPPFLGLPGIDWDVEGEALYDLLLPELLTAATIGGMATLLDLQQRGVPTVGFDWAQINETAAAWAEAYTFGLVRELTATTQAQLQEAVAAFHRTPGMTRGELERLILQGPDGIPDLQIPGRFYPAAERAEMIAVTEVTRSYSAGEVAAMEGLGVPYRKPKRQPAAHVLCRCSLTWQTGADGSLRPIWNTLNDDLVCEICAPLNGKDVSLDD